MDSANAVTPEQLAKATKDYAKALELRDSDPETAIELMGQVLETRNKAYGEKAFQCADVYLYYGEMLFEQAQANTDYFGDQMKSAAMQRARQIAAGEGGDADSGDEHQRDEDGAEPGDDEQMAEAEGSADERPAGVTAEPTVQTAQQQTVQAAEQQESPAPTADDTSVQVAEQQETPAAAEVAGAEGSKDEHQAADEQASAGEEEEGGEDDEKEDDAEDVGTDDEAAEGQEEEKSPDVTGETDDMALAWEMLEMARIIYNEHGGAESHANKLADCHMYIGDILCEQEKFEEAVPEYNAASEMLSKLDGGVQAHKRRAAELDFKKATALQLTDQPAEALAAMRSAKAHLQARLSEVNVELGKSGAAGSSGAAAAAAGDAAGAAAFAALAAVLTGYTKAEAEQEKKDEGANDAAAQTAEDAEKAAAVVAKQHQEAADLRSLIDSINDRIDELTAAVEEHTSMKEQLRKTFEMVAAGKGGETVADQDVAAQDAAADATASVAAGATVSTGFAAPSMPSKSIQDMGVIGKGKRSAPVPVSAATDAKADEGAEGSKKRSLSDLQSSDQTEGDEAAAGAIADKVAAAAAQQEGVTAKKARADV